MKSGIVMVGLWVKPHCGYVDKQKEVNGFVGITTHMYDVDTAQMLYTNTVCSLFYSS